MTGRTGSIGAFGFTLALSLVTAPRPGFAAETPPLSPLLSGDGRATFGGLFQSWLTSDSASPVNFRMRRAELKFSGSVAENTRWFTMIDAAKSLKTGLVSSANDNKVLQDLGVAFSLNPELELMMGQFKAPNVSEGLEPSAELLFPERSLTTRTFGDRREPGAMLAYTREGWKVRAMVSNGGATNTDDPSGRKDLTLRIDMPVILFLKAGAFTTAGNFSYGKRALFGANASSQWGDLLVRSEYVHSSVPGTTSSGWYADAAYNLLEDSRLQPAVRYENFRAEAGGNESSGSSLTMGLNYFVARHHSKIQAAYSILSGMIAPNWTAALSPGRDGGAFVLAFQAAI